MTDREKLHKLLDSLPDEALPAVAHYLASVAAGMPAYPPEDEELSADEEAMWAASEAAIARGEVMIHSTP